MDRSWLSSRWYAQSGRGSDCRTVGEWTAGDEDSVRVPTVQEFGPQLGGGVPALVQRRADPAVGVGNQSFSDLGWQ
jgi:hypothetical protein